MVAAGLLAAAVGIAFDWQQLFPALGNRIAAACAVFAGYALLGRTVVGEWFRKLVDWVISLCVQMLSQVSPEIAAAFGSVVVGLLMSFLFLEWLLRVLPNLKILQNRWLIGPGVSKDLTSPVIWSGLFFGVFAAAIPGLWGDFADGVLALVGAMGHTIGQRVMG